MILRVDVKPELLRWARERAGIEPDALVKRFPRYRDWESGQKRPTLKQLEKLAKVTHAPIGSFFLSRPLEERVPIPDLRTVGNRPMARPSVDLLDTVYLCQQRQDWYRDFARMEGEDPLSYVGSATPASVIESTAEKMRAALGLDLDQRCALTTWTEALRRFIEQADALGVLVMTSGIVGNNTHRKLDRDEFQGFALVDEYAPLIFVNSADFVAAQMFTLCHELAHIFIGAAGISKFDALQPSDHAVERFCDQTAAEFLIPSDELRRFWSEITQRNDAYDAIARHFKVSQLVAARRAQDLELTTRSEFLDFYERFLASERRRDRPSGGNFWNTQNTRIGRRFEEAIVRAVREDRLL